MKTLPKRTTGEFVLNPLVWQVGGAYCAEVRWPFPVATSSAWLLRSKLRPAGAPRGGKQTQQWRLKVEWGVSRTLWLWNSYSRREEKQEERRDFRNQRSEVRGQTETTVNWMDASHISYDQWISRDWLRRKKKSEGIKSLNWDVTQTSSHLIRPHQQWSTHPQSCIAGQDEDSLTCCGDNRASDETRQDVSLLRLTAAELWPIINKTICVNTVLSCRHCHRSQSSHYFTLLIVYRLLIR